MEVKVEGRGELKEGVVREETEERKEREERVGLVGGEREEMQFSLENDILASTR